MELKDQVCTLESAKRLRELGVEQESLFYWDCDLAFTEQQDMWTLSYGEIDAVKAGYATKVSAFTSSELGELLPGEINNSSDLSSIKMQGGDWLVSYTNSQTSEFMELNEAEARAKMLIHLLENNLMDNNK
jgi:hypothetical protein